MKKTLSILLLICMLINICGYVVLYLQIRSEIRAEMFRKISTQKSFEGICLIRVKKNGNESRAINWKEDNEFEYKGKLYDIVKTCETKDSVFFYCMNDEKEEQLIVNFIHQSENSLKGNYYNSKFEKNIVNLISQALIKNKFLSSNIFQTQKTGELKAPAYESVTIPIPSPPPEYNISENLS